MAKDRKQLNKRKATQKRDSHKLSATEKQDAQKRGRNRLDVGVAPGEADADVVARAALIPCVGAAMTTRSYSKRIGDLDLIGLVNALSEQTKAIHEGDLTYAEELLTGQAASLNAIFHKLAQQALDVELIDQFETLLRLGLRAQNQCRTTVLALAEIKFPKHTSFVSQKNVAHGPQQVNNASPAPSDAPRAGENPNLQNKLLEKTDGQRLDTTATDTTSGADPALAPVGEVNGS